MTGLYELKDRLFRFCGAYEVYLKFVYRFVIALALFGIINGTIGFMESLSPMLVTVVLAFVCCLLPQGFTLFVAAVLVVAHLFVLSAEVAITALAIFIIIFLVYFRFAPQDGVLFALTPIFFATGVPYILPVAAGLLRKKHSTAAIVCGVIAFFFVDGIYENVSALAATQAQGEEATAKITITVSQLLSNKEMYLTVAIFALSTIVVAVVKKMIIDHAWKIAIVSGVLVQICGLIAGYFLFNITGKTFGMIVGNAVALALGFLIEFLFMDLDYSRTERVQFEDDDYYYYVKAVPKKMVASSEKTVKQFGGAGTSGKKKPEGKPSTRQSIVEELDIDEDFWK